VRQTGYHSCDSPNLQMMLRQIKFWMALDEIVASASAYTHFVKYFVATNIYFLCQTIMEKGPSMSIPHKSKNHVPDIEIISYGGIRDILLLNWYFSHFRTKAIASNFIVGQ
jgi:hypothetical protein